MFEFAVARGTNYVHDVYIARIDYPGQRVVLIVKNNHQELTYHLPLGVVITINGEPSRLGKLRKGMRVISYTEADAKDLSQLDVRPK